MSLPLEMENLFRREYIALRSRLDFLEERRVLWILFLTAWRHRQYIVVGWIGDNENGLDHPVSLAAPMLLLFVMDPLIAAKDGFAG